jgi:hypothetical protein
VTVAEVKGQQTSKLALRFLGSAGGHISLPFVLAVCNGDTSSATRYSGALKHDALKAFIEGFRGGRKCASSVKLDPATDFSKLRVAQLKEILRSSGEGCPGCLEKDDFVRALQRMVAASVGAKTEL